MTRDFQSGDYVAVHAHPAWREKADFIIRASLDESDGQHQWEQLWAKRIDENRFVLCCIPFFAYDLALGDEVETDCNYVVTHVVKPSGQFTFRVWFGESAKSSIREEVLGHLSVLNATIEWSSRNLLAVSVGGIHQAEETAGYLGTQEASGHLVYETGKT